MAEKYLRQRSKRKLAKKGTSDEAQTRALKISGNNFTYGTERRAQMMFVARFVQTTN
jgi:hypothetical protein